MLNNPVFSIVTCTYQAARFVARCYWSLSQQSVKNWEWIVVDDGSRDNTGSIICSLNDPRIRYFRLDKNVGRGLARERALALARGRWIVLQDMDDLSFPDRLEQAQGALRANRQFLCSPMVLIDDNYTIRGVRGLKSTGYPKAFTHATICGDADIIRGIGYPPYRRAQDVRLVYTIANNYNGEFHVQPLYVYHESANAALFDALQGQYYFYKQIGELVDSGALRHGSEMALIRAARVAKMAGLLPFFLFPPMYRLTLRWRANYRWGRIEALEPNRTEFVREAARLWPLA